MKLKFLIVSIIVLLALVAYKTYHEYSALKAVDSYKTCMASRGRISPSVAYPNPPICITRLGSRFTQSLTIPTPTPMPLRDITNWKTYTNNKYHFELKYPSEPNLRPIEVNIYQNYQDYRQKCEDGIYDGCGGSRWPDYKITFFRSNGKGAFDVSIWKGEEVAQFIQSIPHNGYAYTVSTFRSFDEDGEIDPIDENTINQIYSTLKFTDQ